MEVKETKKYHFSDVQGEKVLDEFIAKLAQVSFLQMCSTWPTHVNL
jgi:hypothetical protein